MACTRDQMTDFFDALLHPDDFSDYCPNGLQVEGKSQIKHLVTGVTASQALVDAAIAEGADAILVHHGYFWRAEDPRIVGIKAQRLRALLAAEINLFAYHLPLDCHPEVGNNVTLGHLMGVADPRPLDASDSQLPLYAGSLPAPIAVEQLAENMTTVLDRPPLLIGEGAVQQLVWCTGEDRAISIVPPMRALTFLLPVRYLSRQSMWRASAASPLLRPGITRRSATVCKQ